MPMSITVCGEFEEVSMMVNVAVRVPVPVGVKTKEMGQATCGLNRGVKKIKLDPLAHPMVAAL